MRTNLLSLLIVLFSYPTLHSQSITYQVDGDRLYLSEGGDCSGGPDPRWRLRVRSQYTGYSNWNHDADNITSGWHNYTNYSWVNNTSVSNNAYLTVQLDAWEEDPWTCDNPCFFCSNGGPDDGDCFGYSTVDTRTITDYAPCQWNYFQAFRSCTDDGVTINWGVEYSFYYTYDDLDPGSISGGGSVYPCDDPSVISSTSSATKWSSYQWQISANGGSSWTNLTGATNETYDPPALTSTSLYRRSVTDCSGRVRYSNTVTFNVLSNGNPGLFGNDTWYVYAYNGRDRDNLNSITYGGYYIDNNLSISTTNYWGSGNSPSSASGYTGCTIQNDNHTFVHKRQGFPCGVYDLSITGHDDEISVYVDGAQEFVYNGCCTNHGVVWTGYLATASTIEIRVAEGGGGSNLNMNLSNITSSLSGGVASGDQSICPGGDPAILSSVSLASGGTTAFTGVNYQWEQSTVNCSSGFSNITGAVSSTYNPPANPGQTIYYRRKGTDVCGNIGYSNCVTVVRNTNSTAAIIAAISGKQCPNSSLALSASGGVAGTGASLEWYSGPNGTGTYLGSGSVITVAPNVSTTYYVRREGSCNTTSDDNETIDVRDYLYTTVGATNSSGYCTDDAGWSHFYDNNDGIIFSINGDLSGATSVPSVSINNNGSYYQTSVGGVGSCVSGWSAGEEQFEMQRSWNVDFSGSLNPPYTVRYYFPAVEKTDVENAAVAHIANNPSCSYYYKYSTPLGFYWFKNIGATYVAPTYDQGTHLTATTGAINGFNYSEISGISSFSGGSGGIIIVSDPGLPVELSSFTGWNENTINHLKWLTETEINSDRFEIERSGDSGNNFEKIGTVKASGNSTVQLLYNFTDLSPFLGYNYYRLKQVDLDGTFTYSKTIAIEVKGDEQTSMFYPNPFSNEMTYQFNGNKLQNLSISITDMLGRVLLESKHSTHLGLNRIVLDLKKLVSGTYLISVKNSDEFILNEQKIIKQ
ncbi:T9SS type A sorting domain-containing protein [Aureispira]|nr:T9SS type A sorting domain-containing protein [Aureispira sp.]